MKTEQEAIRIREAYLRAGSIKAAARECGCTWRTAKAALARDYSLDEGKTHRHVKQNTWNERIQQLILQNIPYEAKCSKIRLTAKRIADIIQAEGASLSARQVQRIASRIREDIRNAKSDDAKLITRGIPGCWQVDFGEMDCVIKGREIRAHLLILSSRYSNACVCTVCESEQSEALFDGLWRCFVSLGGVPPVLRFDNMAPVACWCRGRERKLTDAFSRFAVHCGFSPELCNPRSGWEKGNVECKVKYIRSNFFVPVPAFESIEDLNGALEKWCIDDRDRKHYLKGIRIRDLLCSEATTFLPLPDTRFELWRQYITHTDRQGCIQFENNRYFAHRALARAQVIVCVSTHQVCIYDANRRLISSHLRLYGRGNVSQPVLELAQMLAAKPSALPYVVPTAKSALDDLRKLRIADRVGPVTQLIMTAGADTCTDIQFAMDAKKE